MRLYSISFKYNAGQRKFITVILTTLVTKVAQKKRFYIIGPVYKADQKAVLTVFLKLTLLKVAFANNFKIF